MHHNYDFSARVSSNVKITEILYLNSFTPINLRGFKHLTLCGGACCGARDILLPSVTADAGL